jgi:hypothetical protein
MLRVPAEVSVMRSIAESRHRRAAKDSPSRKVRTGAALAFVVLGVVACSSSGGGASPATPGDGGSTSSVEQTRLAIVAVIAADPRLAGTTALTPDDYQALAAKLAAVPGLDGADYAGDGLGTIYIKVTDGGFLVYRHIKNDFGELATLPPNATFANPLDPVWNAGWRAPVETSQMRRIKLTDADANTYATRFPRASANPDPDFTADLAVQCPDEGKIAIVDFQWTEGQGTTLYTGPFNVDGVMLYDRITRMAEAARFHVDVFKDGDINLGNYTKLHDYTIVITIGHGSRPPPKPSERLKEALLTMRTAEIYRPDKDANKVTAFGKTYDEAWKEGDFTFDPESGAVAWTPRLFRNHYFPTAATPQMFMVNSCWSMLPFNVGLVHGAGGWTWSSDASGPLFTFGDALMQAGVKVVFGYVTPATPAAIVENTMPFFRRMFGGYSSNDLPPSPHHFWPTCMGAQTYFRVDPYVAAYAPKLRLAGGEPTIYTMDAVTDNQTFRKACSSGIPHALLQDFTLQVGTPATAIPDCWTKYWSGGTYPSQIQDAYCWMGDDPTTQEATNAAACDVRIARQVTNAMLSK